MSFISYAQNFEDVMLWRALKHVETGFYIDVGANDPDADSVTKAFYERGWRGINIDPVPQWFQRLQEARKRDINLQLAVGKQAGEITLYEVPDTGLSTAEKSFAERHQAEMGYQCQELTVRQETLANLCEQYHIAPIHFLKIDVEGMEKSVLEGADFTAIRPWIVVVESTLPNSQKESFSEWEPIILSAGYQHAYGDGINRFYVADEHSELLGAFQYPPNVFDDFVLNKHLETEWRAKSAEDRAEKAERRTQEALATIKQYQDEIEHSAADIEQITEKLQNTEHRAREAESKAKEVELEHQQTRKRLEQSEARSEEEERVIAKVQADNEQLKNQLNNSTAKVEQLEHELGKRKQELASEQSALEQERERSQWLQNEWDAAKARSDELNHSSHHWWTVADGFNQELQSIYNSRFWRLTWPLRKAMQGLKAMFQFLAGLIQLPKKAARWLVSKAITYILRRDRLKHRARQYLYRHPKLEAHLRAFARSRGLIPGFMPAPQHSDGSTIQAGDEQGDSQLSSVDSTNNADLLSTLTPRARQIYKELKTAIEQRQGSTG